MVIQDIMQFWFDELEPKQWFMKDLALDATIAQRFTDIHRAASQGELFSWRDTAQGRLAEIIILDQFSRNIYRDTAQAFAYDNMALVLAQEAIAIQADEAVAFEQRMFMYMPFMHSESPLIHEKAVELFSLPGAEYNYAFELKHQAIIQQFGRYPHRNAALDRTSTAEEIAFLQQPNSSF